MKIDEELVKKLIGIERSMESPDGLELCDPQSKYVEIGPRRLSLAEQIKRVLRKEVQRYVAHAEMESPEEAADFDIEDEDPLPLSGFEYEDLVEDIVETSKEVNEAIEKAEEAVKVPQDPGEPEVPQAPGEPEKVPDDESTT